MTTYIIKAYRTDGNGGRLIDVPVKHQTNARDAAAKTIELSKDNTIAAIKVTPQFGNSITFVRNDAKLKSMFPGYYFFEYINVYFKRMVKKEQYAESKRKERDKMVCKTIDFLNGL